MSFIDSWYFPIIMLVILFGVAFSGIMYTMYAIQVQAEEGRSELEIERQQNREHWNTLNCDGKNDYLQDKDLSSSTIFYYNQNEDFYREYVLDCLPQQSDSSGGMKE